MPVMFPERLPRDIRDNFMRGAECLVYDRLREVLDNEWHVYYSRPWMGLTPDGREVEGETDFILAHPQKGILCLEVKGGEISYHPESDEWFTTPRGMTVRIPIKNPFTQAQKAKYNILQQLQNSALWTSRRISIKHGVIFPGAQVGDRSYGADKPRNIICDRDQLTGTFERWIEAFFPADDAATNRTRELGRDGIAVIQKILAAPIKLRLPLASLLADDDQQMDILTVRQYQLLDMTRDIPRLAIKGAAGTGKTVLACEMATREAESGKKVLLTCFNEPLSRHLRSILPRNVTVFSFHSLCSHAAKSAGIKVDEGAREEDLYGHILPEALSGAIDIMSDFRFYTVIVDEGQDFLPDWWIPIDSLVHPSGRLIVFYDANQRIYTDAKSLPSNLMAAPISLNQNLRNTDPIHSLTMQHYAGDTVLPNGIMGRPPEIVAINSPPDLRPKLGKILRRYIEAERISPDEIAILAVSRRELDSIAPDGLIGGYPVAPAGQIRSDHLTLDTIRRYKGLDARIIILICSDNLIGEKELCYIACSRARTHLILMGADASISAVSGMSPTRDELAIR